MDLDVTPALTIPAQELSWRFSRSSGPGGQHVNTTDSRVELIVDVVTASERRSQLRNREIALAKLAQIIAAGLAPGAVARRPTKSSRGSKMRHMAAKQQRSATKRQRQRPYAD